MDCWGEWCGKLNLDIHATWKYTGCLIATCHIL
jgi:hypothetical protein